MEKFIKQAKDENNNKKKSLPKINNFKSVLIGGGVILALGFAVFFLRGGTEVQVKTGVSTKEVKNTVTEIVEPIYSQQKEIKKQTEETQKTLQALNENIKELNQTLKQLKEEKQTSTYSQEVMPQEVIQGESVKPKKQEPLFHHIEVVKLEPEGSKEVSKLVQQVKKKQEKKPSVYIPAGSIVEGKLLYGFVAPESGMFPPVVVEFTKPIRTANDFFIPAQKCLITTSAQYDISQGVAILGGVKSTLSCVLRNGKVVEVPVNIAVGEEIKGKTVQIGLSGEEKWLTGKDFATITGMVSLSGMASSYKQGLVQQSLTPQGNAITVIKDRGLYSVAGGVNAGVNKFVEFWMKKYDKKVPAIEVKPKKRVFVVFVNGADLKVSPKELEL